MTCLTIYYTVICREALQPSGHPQNSSCCDNLLCCLRLAGPQNLSLGPAMYVLYPSGSSLFARARHSRSRCVTSMKTSMSSSQGMMSWWRYEPSNVPLYIMCVMFNTSHRTDNLLVASMRTDHSTCVSRRRNSHGMSLMCCSMWCLNRVLANSCLDVLTLGLVVCDDVFSTRERLSTSFWNHISCYHIVNLWCPHTNNN